MIIEALLNVIIILLRIIIFIAFIWSARECRTSRFVPNGIFILNRPIGNMDNRVPLIINAR